MITPDSVADLEELWVAAEPSGRVGHPVTSNAAVHASIGHGDGADLVAFDRATGEELWSDGVLTPMGFGPAVFSDDVLWVGYGMGNLGGSYTTELVDPATGDPVGPPLDADGLVAGVRGRRYLLSSVGFGSGGPFGFSVSVGDLDHAAESWSGVLDVQDLGGVGWSSPTLGEDLLYQAGHGLNEYADGVVQGNGVRGYTLAERPDCPPSLPDSLVCPTWATAIDGATATAPVLAPGESTLFTVTDVGTVYAVDASNGEVAWSTSVGAGVVAEPALAEGNLFVPTTDGSLVVLDAADGSTLWEATAGNRLRVQPAVAGGLVFTGAIDGSLAAFAAAGCGAPTCDPLWSTTTAGPVTGAPAVSSGQLYVGTSGGLVAYGLPESESE